MTITLVEKGYLASYEEIGGANAIGTDKQIQSGTAAMGLSGSWMISTFSKLTDASGKKPDIGLAPTPIGPTGKRASMSQAYRSARVTSRTSSRSD